jgi:hypothetical protein
MLIIPPSSGNYTLDLNEMLDEVRNILRNKNIDTDITRWINLAILYYAGRYAFPGFEVESSFTTTSNTRTYGLNTDMQWLRTVVDPANNRPLYPENEIRLSRTDPRYKTLQGTVVAYTLSGLTLNLYRVPSGTFTYLYSYQRRPLRLTSLADVCDLPAEWHPLITLEAAKRGLRREGRFDEIGEIKADIKDMEHELKKTVYNRPDDHRVLSGPQEYGMSRPWPQLPNSYPRTW